MAKKNRELTLGNELLETLKTSPYAKECREIGVNLPAQDIVGMRRALQSRYTNGESHRYHVVVAQMKTWANTLTPAQRRVLQKLTREERILRQQVRQARARDKAVRVAHLSRLSAAQPSRVGDLCSKKQPHHKYPRSESPLEFAFRMLPENVMLITESEHDRIHAIWRATKTAPKFPEREVMEMAVRRYYSRKGKEKEFELLMEQEAAYQEKLITRNEQSRALTLSGSFGFAGA